MGNATVLVLSTLVILVAACSSTRIATDLHTARPAIAPMDPSSDPLRPSHARVTEEWRGRVVEVDRIRGYVVVRSKDRLLDHVFQITTETEIDAGTAASKVLEPGQWVAVEYQRDATRSGPPVALRIVVILP